MPRVNTSISLEPAIRHALRVYCASQEISQADFVNQVIEEALEAKLGKEGLAAIAILAKTVK